MSSESVHAVKSSLAEAHTSKKDSLEQLTTESWWNCAIHSLDVKLIFVQSMYLI